MRDTRSFVTVDRPPGTCEVPPGYRRRHAGLPLNTTKPLQ
jgi:hypothetical protein